MKDEFAEGKSHSKTAKQTDCTSMHSVHATVGRGRTALREVCPNSLNFVLYLISEFEFCTCDKPIESRLC